MSAVIEVPELDSWFLVDWPDGGSPGVVMEFGARHEAERALAAAVADGGGAPLRLTVRSGLAMLEDPDLRAALAAWDLEFAER